MTVAAVALVPDVAVAMSDAHGELAIRRVLHAAWAGGALPLVVVAPPGPLDPSLVAALADLPATIARPQPGTSPGIAWFLAGLDAAAGAVRETAAALLWPCRYAWVDPETITSLVEAHGTAPDEIIVPAFGGATGFPVLVPIGARAALAGDPTRHAPDALRLAIEGGFASRTVELGDPGIVHDVSTSWAELPRYQGPQPKAGEAPG